MCPGPARETGAPPPRPPRENISRRTSSFHEIGVALVVAVAVGFRAGLLEITVVTLARPLVAGGVDFAAVVAPALLRIAHEVVGGGDLLELLLGLTIPGIEVRMQFLRQCTVGRADLVLRCVRLHAQDGIRILAHVALLSGSLARRKERDPMAEIKHGGADGMISVPPSR